ncbi:hypothetical protein KA005_06760 [bacterium]|nr:hypothetical protein [bacterium]
MKFAVETLRELSCEEAENYATVKETVVDTGRWTIQYEVIFKDLTTGKHYRTYWQRGATEYQDEQPFEYDKGEIDCDEVELVEVMVKEWRKVK